MLNRHFRWVRAVVTIAAMTARCTADLSNRLFGLALVALLPPAAQAVGDTLGPSGMPPALVQAQKIRAQINVRYLASRGTGLAVTEASSTGVVESFSLLTPGPEGRPVVPAHGGTYFAICPRHADCPYPARGSARPAAAFLPRGHGLELALRTFFETRAEVVAISLPTTRFVLFIVERGGAGSGHVGADEETRGRSRDRR